MPVTFNLPQLISTKETKHTGCNKQVDLHNMNRAVTGVDET